MDTEKIVSEIRDQIDPKNKKIRIVRVIVYEGDADIVIDKVAKSLPQGTRNFGSYSITVAEHSRQLTEMEDAAARQEADRELAINSIKEIREKSGCGLAEAKWAWDLYHDVNKAIEDINKLGGLRLLDVVVPPCGHPYCEGFMGCVEEASRQNRWPILHPSPSYPPGSTVRVRVIHSTGLRHRDWQFPPRSGE